MDICSLSNTVVYNTLNDGFDKVDWMNYIWFKCHSLKFSLTTLKVIINGFKTYDILLARGIHVGQLCVLCKENLETQNNLFFECKFTYNLFKTCIIQAHFFLYPCNFLQTQSHVESLAGKIHKRFYLLAIHILTHFIWLERNNIIFNGGITPQNFLV